jgi:ADP-heptose:LPS heptosyltransferase
MSRRQRWKPVRGTGSRVYDPWERALLWVADLPGRVTLGAARRLRGRRAAARLPEQVLVLRLDRIGDVLMSLPALADLRAALPQARIRLAVGPWSEDVARRAPVDEVLVWSAPWVGRAAEGAEPLLDLCRRARRLRSSNLDLAIDLQGDVRATLLMWLTGAARRIGYANTGGEYLLTDVVPLDETVSWVTQNRRAVWIAVGRQPEAGALALFGGADRDFSESLFGDLGLRTGRPRVGVHPSGGRRVKQWPVARWAEVAARLEDELGAEILVTGSTADRPLAAELNRLLPRPAHDLTGRLSVGETLALIGSLDLFLSPDTGPMHMACLVDTPSISVFGPSDPMRYFSAAIGDRHRVVRHELWCSPCNLIRRPPAECAGPEPPECLAGVTPEEVYATAREMLVAAGFVPERGSGLDS